VPPFSVEEAETVYRRYQKSKEQGEPVPACITPWERIPPRTRETLLLVPLPLDLWMRAFDGREALTVSGESDLFEFYLDDIRRRFDRFWESMSLILDFMLEKGKMELDEFDAREIETKWQKSLTEVEMRLRFSPLEVACASGVMQKRTREEGGGYRIPHQRLREALIYMRLKERDPQLSVESVRQWLDLPPTEELEGAISTNSGGFVGG
jgi:hypothetical protein